LLRQKDVFHVFLFPKMIAHYLVFNKERNIILTHFQDLRYFIGLEQFDLFNNLTLDVNKMRFNQNNIN